MNLSDEDVLYLHTKKKIEFDPSFGRSFTQIEREQVYGVTPSKKFTVKPEVHVHRNPYISNNLHKREESIIGKKLSLTPSTVKQSKITGRKRQSSDGPSYTDMVAKQKFTRDKGHTLPEHMISNFRPTVDMHLNIDELYLAAYIFNPYEDISEEVFKIGEIVGTLKEFGSLCPDRVPVNEILTFIAAKNTWLKDFEKSHKIWCLPPSFSHDVCIQETMEVMIDKYYKDWMPIYDDLKYICIPIEEVTSQWYLMVISIHEGIIYHLDPFILETNINPRRRTIRIVSEVIAQIMRTDWFPPKFVSGKIDLDLWEISDAFKPSKYSGETEFEYISKSILWIMDWMYMRSSFQPNILREMNENVLRMKVAMDLLNGQHKELWNGLQAKSKGFWMMPRYNEHQG